MRQVYDSQTNHKAQWQLSNWLITVVEIVGKAKHHGFQVMFDANRNATT